MAPICSEKSQIWFKKDSSLLEKVQHLNQFNKGSDVLEKVKICSKIQLDKGEDALKMVQTSSKMLKSVQKSIQTV